MAMYRCGCDEWVSSTEKHKCKTYPFNVLKSVGLETLKNNFCYSCENPIGEVVFWYGGEKVCEDCYNTRYQ